MNQNHESSSKQLDIAIKKSFKWFKESENQTMENALKESLYQQEQHETAID